MYNDLKQEEIMGSEKTFLKRRKNGIMLSDDDIRILERYNIDYLKYKNLKELIFDITSYLNENPDCQDLSMLETKLGEYNYYFYTNK